MKEPGQLGGGDFLYNGGEKDQIVKLFGHCFEMNWINDGDLIPIGGRNKFSGETNIKVLADFGNLSGWFGQMQEMKRKIMDLKGLMAWAEIKGLDINVFASIASFTKVFDKVYEADKEPVLSRESLYRQGNVRLSDVFRAGVAECAEIAAVAQYGLQQQDIISNYFSGDVLWKKIEEGFSGEHSFIVIPQGRKTLIFDPANPINTTEGLFPSIYDMEFDFNKEVADGHKKFVTAKNVLNGREAYFGVNNGTNVSKADIV